MFPLSMANQRDKFVSALGRIVSHADQIENDVDFLRHLGRDHRKYAVVAEHYNAVGASLCCDPEALPGVRVGRAARRGMDGGLPGDRADHGRGSGDVVRDQPGLVGRRRGVGRATDHGPHPADGPAQTHVPVPPRPVSVDGDPATPEQWRYFSPANAPRHDGSIDLHVQQIDGGQVSTAVVRSLKVGDTVKLGAPVGERLTRRADDPSDLLMVAGGTGLAPLRAVIEQIDQEWQRSRTAPRVHLLHGVRMPWHLYDRPLAARAGHSSARGSSTRRSSRTTRPIPGRAARSARSLPGRRCSGARRWCAVARRWSGTR